MTDANTGCARNQGTTQFCAEAVEAHKDLRDARAEIERLRARVGWLDHLDTEEGRKAHANEALLLENEQLKAELAKLKECTP